jgi:hypothetical protein
METTKVFVLNGKSIQITNTLDELDSSKIYTNRYFYMMQGGQRRPVIGKTPKIDYYSQIEKYVNFLQGKTLTERDFFEALIEGCRNHILKYGRLIISDLWTQLTYTMHIVDATKGVFHDHINTEDEGIELREFYLRGAQELFLDFILVPDPNDIGSFGRTPNLVPLKSIINK